jgi:hypothetical protein
MSKSSLLDPQHLRGPLKRDLCLPPLTCSEAEKLEAAEEEGRNNDVWAGMEADDPELQAALIRAGGLGAFWRGMHCNGNTAIPCWHISCHIMTWWLVCSAGALSGDAAEEHCIIIINSLGIIQVRLLSEFSGSLKAC